MTHWLVNAAPPGFVTWIHASRPRHDLGGSLLSGRAIQAKIRLPGKKPHWQLRETLHETRPNPLWLANNSNFAIAREDLFPEDP